MAFSIYLKQKKKKLLSLLKLFFISSFACLFFYLALNLRIQNQAKPQIYQDIEQVSQQQVALLPGALVYADGGLSGIVQDRADTAIALYKLAKVDKILVSGDHGRREYDEVNTIKNYLLEQGVAAQDIFMDHAGFDTYDSLYRAKAIFQVESMIIVTQQFHLPRALYLARALDIKAVGCSADLHHYANEPYNRFRESLANIKAFINVITQAKPKYLGEAIPITGDSKASWD